MNDEIIEEIFKKIIEDGSCKLSLSNIELKIQVSILLTDGFIAQQDTHSQRYFAIGKGIDVVSAGGWIKYKYEQQKLKTRTENKEKYEYRLTKFKYITFWVAIILGVIGGIHSITEMIQSYTENRQPKKESIEAQSQQRISSEYQKKYDGLHSKAVDKKPDQEKIKGDSISP